MPGLFDSLSFAANALNAQRMGLDVVGQNMANVNTAGYTRRTLELGALPPTDANNIGRGVEVLGLRAARDRFVEARLRLEQQGVASAEAQIRQLSVFQAGLGQPGAGLDARLTALFDAFQSFSIDVTSPTARDVIVAEAKGLTLAFNAHAASLADNRRSADGQIRADVAEVNVLVAEVALYNDKIVNSPNFDVEGLKDKRSLAVARLAALAGTTATERNDGAINVVAANGMALVVGGDSFRLDTTTGALGMAFLSVSGTDVTTQLGGDIAGLLRVRDTVVPGYQTALDQLAYDIATQVNALHTTGFDANGAAAGDLFTAPAAVAGAAFTMSVDAAVVANSSLVAGSLTASAGDNQLARALAALRDTRFASGGTATASEAWGQLVYSVGAEIAAAEGTVTTLEQVVLQLQRLRDAASGVSLDEEAAWLMKFQRAYEANARYFTSVSDTLDVLMRMV
jgi:flagellar hook-associated protein 1